MFDRVQNTLMNTEAYLESNRTPEMELFCENNLRLRTINYLC